MIGVLIDKNQNGDIEKIDIRLEEFFELVKSIMKPPVAKLKITDCYL